MAQERRKEPMQEVHGTTSIFLLSHFGMKIIHHTLSKRHKPALTCPRLTHEEGHSIPGERWCLVWNADVCCAMRSRGKCHGLTHLAGIVNA